MRKTNKSVLTCNERSFHLMLLPAVILTLIYGYLPLMGNIMAFQKFNPILGFLGSKWVGLKNFKYILNMPDIGRVVWNTCYIGSMKVFAGILIPLIIALLLNEITKRKFKRSVQTILFVPYFLSWAVVGGIFKELLSVEGPINGILSSVGIHPIMFMLNNTWFPFILVFSDVWKNMGYNMVILLAAITGIDAVLYEAASVDGAGRFKQLWSITLPAIFPTIILLFTLGIGLMLSGGLDQVFIMYNAAVYQSGDIIDTFVYRLGLVDYQYSVAAAVGLSKCIVSAGMVSGAYYLAYKFSNYRIF